MSRKFEYSTLWNWNGDMLCAIDVKTTGVRPKIDEIVQLCFMPLDSEIRWDKTYTPFYTSLQPTRHEQYFPTMKRAARTLLAQAKLSGLDPDRARDLFDEWYNKLNLPRKKRLIPLATNWLHSASFLMEWLGPLHFHHYFDYRYRDITTIASFLNDEAEFKIEQIPYPKTFLQFLCSQLKIERQRKKDSLNDCLCIAECYRELMKRSIS